MKIMTCPINGPRPVSEFYYWGEVRPMPDPETCGDAEWADAIAPTTTNPRVVAVMSPAKREGWPSVVVPSGNKATWRPRPRRLAISAFTMRAWPRLPRRRKTVSFLAASQPISGHSRTSAFEMKAAG